MFLQSNDPPPQEPLKASFMSRGQLQLFSALPRTQAALHSLLKDGFKLQQTSEVCPRDSHSYHLLLVLAIRALTLLHLCPLYIWGHPNSHPNFRAPVGHRPRRVITQATVFLLASQAPAHLFSC